MAVGTAVLDFGAFPGTDRATVAVTGQAAILGTSKIEAWLSGEATAVHSEDELAVLAASLGITIPPSLIVAGTGFTIVGINPEFFVWGTVTLNWAWA